MFYYNIYKIIVQVQTYINKKNVLAISLQHNFFILLRLSMKRKE